jgi:hypothetical protein
MQKKIKQKLDSKLHEEMTKSNNRYAEQVNLEIQNQRQIIEIPTLQEDYNSYKNRNSNEIFMMHCSKYA